MLDLKESQSVVAFEGSQTANTSVFSTVMDLESEMNKELVAAGNNGRKQKEIIKRYSKMFNEITDKLLGETTSAEGYSTVLSAEDVTSVLEKARSLKEKGMLTTIDSTRCLVCGRFCSSGTLVMRMKDGSGDTICETCFTKAEIRKGAQEILVIK